jgi:hypothetical protein
MVEEADMGKPRGSATERQSTAQAAMSGLVREVGRSDGSKKRSLAASISSASWFTQRNEGSQEEIW